jgi:hypothetical protein
VPAGAPVVPGLAGSGNIATIMPRAAMICVCAMSFLLEFNAGEPSIADDEL